MGFCVPVFDSSGEPAALPGIGDSAEPVGCPTEVGVGHITSCVEGANITMNPPKGLASSMGHYYKCMRRDSVRFTTLLRIRSS